MRIAFITFEYPPFIVGGAGIYAANICNELASLGHQVVVFTPKFSDSPSQIDEIPNIEIRRIELNEKLPFSALQFWLSLPNQLNKAESENKFDIIHFNSLSYCFLKKKISDSPHVVTIHHLTADAIRSNNLSLISRIKDISGENNLLMPFIEKRCIKSADQIISVSKFTKRQIINTYDINPHKIEVVYNGIDFSGYDFNEEEIKETKKELGLGLNTKPILLFVGRVDDPRKGLEILINAMKQVLEKKDVMLLVVGKGNQTDAKNLAESLELDKNILFTGFADSKYLKKYYSLCDVYVCPSKLEGFGLTILEAMVAGKPIVATNVGAIPEIIGDCGILVNSESKEELSKAIINTLDKKMAGTIKITGRPYQFSWGSVAIKLLDIYGETNEMVE